MQSKLRAIFEVICGVLSVGEASTDALLHPNEPSGTLFQELDAVQVIGSQIQVDFFFFL
jgi:hypothetical protein